jgi:hypothetical protein
LPALLVVGAWLVLSSPSSAAPPYFWKLVSPDHEQTFAYGTETNRQFAAWGRDRHLEVLLHFTNDPYVDRDNPRRYDDFAFAFPAVRLDAGGRMFYYHVPGGRKVPVAVVRHDFLGFDQVRLLPNANAVVSLPHGYITVYLNVLDPQ